MSALDPNAVTWCCDELERVTAVKDTSRTWDWTAHCFRLTDAGLTLELISHGGGSTVVMPLNPTYYGTGFDFTVEHCPFCGTATTGVAP